MVLVWNLEVNVHNKTLWLRFDPRFGVMRRFPRFYR